MIRLLSLPKFPKFLTFKGLPEPFNQLARPLVLVSVGLHAALLLTPIPSPPAKPKPVQPKTIKITALPPIKSNNLVKNKFSTKSSVKPLRPTVATKGLVIQRPTKNQKPTKPLNATQPVPSVKPAPVEEASSDPNNPFNDFPHYPGAVPGCMGVQSCYETGKSMDVVSQYFQQELPKKKYTSSQVANDSDRRVFQFTKGGTSQFLNIFSEDKTSFYVLAPQAILRSELQSTVQIPADFNNIMANLPPGADGESTDASPDQFASPNDFFSNLGGDAPDGSVMNPEKKQQIDTIRLVRGQTPQQLLSSYFTQSGYQPKPLAMYGGGQLYELKKGTFKPFYLNLVPAQGGKGTIVVVWTNNPS
jgi:hypothetical protein